MAYGNGRTTGFAIQRLRIEDAYGQRIIVEILFRYRLHFSRADVLQTLPHHFHILPGQADSFHLTNFHRLAKH